MIWTRNVNRMDRIFPGEKVWRFAYDQNESLFRDPVRGRVVGEAKGPGLFQIHEGEITIEVDGSPVDTTNGSFNKHFIAFAPENSSARLEVHLGRTARINPVFWKVPEHVQEFAGWLMPPHDWKFFEPVYTFEALDPHKPVGAPGMHQCLTAASFFLRNEEDCEKVNWNQPQRPNFYEIDGFPAPFCEIAARCSFKVDLVEENEGVQLARILDAMEGPQEVEVWVDGANAGLWYYPFSMPDDRIQADLFGIPTALTTGKAEISVELVVTNSSKPWKLAWIGVDALVPRVN